MNGLTLRYERRPAGEMRVESEHPLTRGVKGTPTTLPADETPGTQYCLRVGPYTGTRLETVQCWTRQQWAGQCINDGWTNQCVDVDKEWAENGVRIQMKE